MAQTGTPHYMIHNHISPFLTPGTGCDASELTFSFPNMTFPLSLLLAFCLNLQPVTLGISSLDTFHNGL